MSGPLMIGLSDRRRSRTVRRLAGLTVPLLVLGLAAPGSAQARDTGYCSPSGDICYGKLRGVRPITLGINMFGEYFSRYRLCVNRTGHARVCKSFRIRKMGKLYGSRVTWRNHFPNQGHGRYRARWRRSGGPLGPPIYFRV
jgi:hypothetical protein